MEQQGTGLKFVEQGIAHALEGTPLGVPLNQRSYAWQEQEVLTLLSDLTKAFDEGESIYFLGMIVLTQGKLGEFEVADGQQRLATTAILIAAIRDYLIELNDVEASLTYERDFLVKYDPQRRIHRAKITLNFEDREFFLERILRAPKDRKEYKGRELTSHRRLSAAAALAHTHVRNLTQLRRTAREKCERLYEVIEFLRHAATVITAIVPGNIGNAFKMFETLNSRGMPASQVDVLKNFLFENAKEKVAEVHPRWNSMLGTIESLGEDDLLMTYVRHYWIAHYGPTTERQIGERVEKTIKSERQVIDTVVNLDSCAVDYVALLTPREHPRWKEFMRDVRNCVFTITKELGIEQIRPLLLAIARTFDVPEAQKAFEFLLSLSVRFLIVGGGGGGVLERQHGTRAMEVMKQEITTTKKLKERMMEVAPTDDVFEKAFAIATVRRAALARYYLRAIELYVKQEHKPQFVPNDDPTAVNLEHVLPVTPSSSWKINPDIATAFYRRLGNMVLLGAKDNVDIGNQTFREKKKIFKDSPYLLTARLASYDQWRPEEIETNQRELAAFAPKVWAL